MEIRNLKTFYTIAMLGSFTKAAETLGYAQSTLTFHIQEIEAHYGRPVFQKAGKHKQLTAFGKQLLEQAEDLLHRYEALEHLGNTEEILSETLRIGAPESLMLYRLYPIIKEYKSLYPQVNISVVNAPCELLREHLLSGQLDVSIMLQPLCDYPSLDILSLLEERMCLVAPAGHQREDMLPEATQMVLHVETKCTYRREFERYLQSKHYVPSSILETSSVEAIKKYILNGMGVSYLPYYAVKDEADRGLVRIRFRGGGLRFYSQIVSPKSKWRSPAMKAFISLCQAYGQSWALAERKQTQ